MICTTQCVKIKKGPVVASTDLRKLVISIYTDVIMQLLFPKQEKLNLYITNNNKVLLIITGEVTIFWCCWQQGWKEEEEERGGI
mmetsp:Transcript_24649/g.42999  ORF Transcript_24649/g.42999 Transcript_24649/m.42999 type:complete len:84 (-) Transcript_24649:54-305(-)